MNNRLVLLTGTVVAMGFFVMPNTLTLFAGQHTFDSGDQVQCNRCHQDIYDEMKGAGMFGVGTAHAGIAELEACEGCHKISTAALNNVPLGKYTENGTYFGQYSRDNLSGAHAAVTMECAGCHSGVPEELLNNSEAHTSYYLNSTDTNSTILKGANEACVGCHTHTNIKATWRRSTGMDLVINETANGDYVISISANTSVNTTHTIGGSVMASP